VLFRSIKFIFITLDFNPSREVVAWVDELLTTYSDYNAIVTMHSFLTFRGNELDIANITDIISSIVQGQYKGAAPDWLWKNCLAKHENVVMTVSGHVGADTPQYLTTVGENGNKVLNILVDPQFYDLNIEPTGAILLMHFYDGGKTIKTEYFSTTCNGYKKDADNRFELELMLSDTSVTEAETTTAATTVSSTTATTVSDTTSDKGGCKSSVSLIPIALVPMLTALGVVAVKKKEE